MAARGKPENGLPRRDSALVVSHFAAASGHLMFADYHLHTPLCGHAVGAPVEYIAAARARGLEEIGFSDHCPMDGLEPFDDWRMTRADLPRYVDMILGAREAAGPFPVRLGLECDFIAGREKWIEELAAAAPWDYLIGSVHYLGPGQDVDNPKWVGRYFAGETAIEDTWARYWREYERCIASGLFDFVAHPDLVKKFGHRPTGDLRRYYEGSIAAAAAGDVTVEISTAGLRKPAGELYPAAGFLTMAHEADVKVVINSDAHAPEEVGLEFDRAARAARAAGYKETARFAKRVRKMVPLD